MLEQDLLIGLRPVEAPAELWDRVRSGRAGFSLQRGLQPPLRFVAMAAAVVLVAAILWGFRPAYPEGAGQVRAWVRTNSGVDVALAARQGVRLVAAHTARETAELAFVVDGRKGRLLISKADAPSSHALPGSLPGNDARVYSWTMSGLAFTLECASPADLRAACVLCHS
jgi:hypothetical protein